MKSQTFILTNYAVFSLTNTRILLSVFGLITIGFYGSGLVFDNQNIFETNIFLIIMSIHLIFIGTVGLSKKSKLSPKVKITSEGILLRKGIFSKSLNFTWSNLHKIELGSYLVTFFTKGEQLTFSLDTSSKISVDIKKALVIAGKHQEIPVIGG
jgi:hypothetical protein